VLRRRLVVVDDILLGDEIVGHHDGIVLPGHDRDMAQVHFRDPAFLAGHADPIAHAHQLAQHEAREKPLQRVLQREPDDRRRRRGNGDQGDDIDPEDGPQEDQRRHRHACQNDQEAKELRNIESLFGDQVVFQYE
jgi:hypothetical protein